jgi:hypothetical protein
MLISFKFNISNCRKLNVYQTPPNINYPSIIWVIGKKKI